MTPDAQADVPIIDVIDVGHGSCVAVRVAGKTTLIDTGPRASILEYMLTEGIEQVDTVIISHADSDHIGGLSALLSEGIDVHRIIWNGDGVKKSAIWEDLLFQLDELEQTGSALTGEEASAGLIVDAGSPRVSIEVVAPRLRLRRRGPGGRDRDGRLITTNSVSVVVRVVVDDVPLILIPGDLDAVGLAHVVDDRRVSLEARYLVLPHHGGLMGSVGATSSAVEALVRTVSPSTVFVSNGRGHFDNPRKDVVAAVRAADPGLPVVCTQLNVTCSADADGAYGSAVYGAGRLRGHSCAGTIRLEAGVPGRIDLDLSAQQQFIADFVPTPRCEIL